MGDDENIVDQDPVPGDAAEGGADAETGDAPTPEEMDAAFATAADQPAPAGTGAPNTAHALDLRELKTDGSGQVVTADAEEMTFELEDEATLGEVPDRPQSAADLEALYDIPVHLAATLGMTTLQVDELLKLGRGAVVELDRKVGEAIDIYVNNRLVARGEVVVVENKLGITMTEIIKTGRT